MIDVIPSGICNLGQDTFVPIAGTPQRFKTGQIRYLPSEYSPVLYNSYTAINENGISSRKTTK